MNRSISHLCRYPFYMPCLFIYILLLTFKSYSQTNQKLKYSAVLDSVKTYYGDTCSIGVSSALIKRLYKYQKYKPVKNYLKSYEEIKNAIEKFRKQYNKSISSDPALLLDVSKIFPKNEQQNIVNVCGIYLGPDSVTSIGLSYIILRSSPSNFYSKVYHVNNFDPTFKEELNNYGAEWYKSIKLKELNSSY